MFPRPGVNALNHRAFFISAWYPEIFCECVCDGILREVYAAAVQRHPHTHTRVVEGL